MREVASTWLRGGTILALGALVVAGIIALVVPQSATDPSGLTGSSLSGGALPESLSMRIDGATNVEISEMTIPPGKDVGGWHEHTGYSLVTVREGIATFYDRDDPTCTAIRHPAGDAILESPHHPHIVRNEGPEPLVLYVVTFTPQGKDSDHAVPASTACHFSSQP